MDCGILKVKKKEEGKQPPQLIYFGNEQYKLYKGFAGITTPILYFFTILTEATLHRNAFAPIILLYPIFIIGIYMPFFLVYETRINKWQQKIVKKLKLTPLTMENVEQLIF